MRLDVGTLAFSTAVLALALAMTTTVIAMGRGDRLTRYCFSGANALYGLALLLIIFGNNTQTALIAGNTLAMASALCAHLGACLYTGRRVHPAFYGGGLLAVTAVMAMSFQEWGGGTATRIIAISAARLPYFLHAAAVLRTHRNTVGRTVSTSVLITMFLSFTLILSLRILDVMVHGVSGHTFTDWSGTQAAYYLMVAAIMLSMSISFTLMCAEEDEKHLRRTIEQRTAELRKAKALAEQASSAKSRFIAAASHDLRQPVHTLRLLISAAEGLIARKDAELRDLVVEMKNSATRLVEYLHALLDISKLDAGVVVPNIRPTALADILADLHKEFSREAEAAHVRLSFVPTSRVIPTDPLLLKRILANLIANAIKFAEGGAVLVGCRHRPGGIEIQVRDNGCGIEESALSEIFDEFRQVGNSARQASKGIGLGLSITQRLSNLLGYRTSATSRIGKGAIFCVQIPTNTRKAMQ